jgi:hypothetical protein
MRRQVIAGWMASVLFVGAAAAATVATHELSGGRVEVPQGGYAITFPDGWLPIPTPYDRGWPQTHALPDHGTLDGPSEDAGRFG